MFLFVNFHIGFCYICSIIVSISS